MYDNESKVAYNGLPRLEIGDLHYGDVINLTPGTVKWNPLVRLAYRAIVREQWKLYGIPYHTSIHSWFHLGYGRIFESTPPHAKYGLVDDLTKLDPLRWYVVCRYRDWEIETAEERELIFKATQELAGYAYDYGQLVAILMCRILHWPEDKYLPFLDFGARQKVCSVLVRGLWLTWYEKYAKGRELGVRRPGGPLHVERTPPALFENHATFKIVGVLNGGAGRI